MWKFEQIFLIAFGAGVLLTPVFRWLAFQLGVLDHPKNHGIHSHPVPRLGGVAIYIAFIAGALFRMDLSQSLKGILLASSVIFFVGLLDDLIHLRASLKLAIQLTACGVMMFKYGVILEVFSNQFANAFFTALGIIGLTNAVNFLDNMDGLAAGLVMIASLTIFWIAYQTEQTWLGYLSMALVGATAAFLLFNLRKAHVFMGDAGSTFLGFTLASLAVMTEWSPHTSVTLAVPILILGVPILDMYLITVLRIKEGKVRNFKEWIDYTGKDHLSHRVSRLGLKKKGAVSLLWGLQGIFCVLALWVFQGDSGRGFVGIGIFLGLTGAFIFFFRKRRFLILRMGGRKPSYRRKKVKASV